PTLHWLVGVATAYCTMLPMAPASAAHPMLPAPAVTASHTAPATMPAAIPAISALCWSTQCAAAFTPLVTVFVTVLVTCSAWWTSSLAAALRSETLSSTSWTPASTASATAVETVSPTSDAALTNVSAAEETVLTTELAASHRPDSQPQPIPDGSVFVSGLFS